MLGGNLVYVVITLIELIAIILEIFVSLAVIGFMFSDELRRFLSLKSRIGIVFIMMFACLAMSGLLAIFGLTRYVITDPTTAHIFYKFTIIFMRAALVLFFFLSVLMRSEKFPPVISGLVLILFGLNMAAFSLRENQVVAVGNLWLILPKYGVLEDMTVLMDTLTLLIIAAIVLISTLYSAIKIIGLLRDKPELHTGMIYFSVGALIGVIGPLAILILRRIMTDIGALALIFSFWFLVIGATLIVMAFSRRPGLCFILPTELRYLLIMWPESGQLITVRPEVEDDAASLYASFISSIILAFNQYIKVGQLRTIDFEKYNIILSKQNEVACAMILSSPLTFYRRLLEFCCKKITALVKKYGIEQEFTKIPEEFEKDIDKIYRRYIEPFII